MYGLRTFFNGRRFGVLALDSSTAFGLWWAFEFHFGKQPDQKMALAGISIAVVSALLSLFKRLKTTRVAQGTPTSKIRSASQGAIELAGKAVAIDPTLVAPCSGMSVAWYRHVVLEKRGSGNKSRWVTVQDMTSQAPIALDDGTGLCILNPNQFDVRNLPSQEHEGDNSWLTQQRHIEYWIADGAALYALGEFKTMRGLQPIVQRFLSRNDAGLWTRKIFEQYVAAFLEGRQQPTTAPLHLLLPHAEYEKSILSCGNQAQFIDGELTQIWWSGFLLFVALVGLYFVL